MAAQRDQPDLILIAQRCYPIRPGRRPARALAIRGGRIRAFGNARRLVRARARRAQVIDLGSAVITPGLVDCHTHFFYWALSRAMVIDVSGSASLEAAVRRIRRQAGARSVGDWVVGRGFDHNVWRTGLPRAIDLDQAVPDRPAIVHSRDGHTAWLNTLGLKRVGVSARTPDPKGGRYLRDARGRPTGIVQETAVDQLPDPLAELARRRDPAALRVVDRALERAYQTAWSLGIVGVHCMEDDAALSHFQRHHHARRLGIRMVHSIPLASLKHACALGLRSGLGDEWLRIGAVKVFADGALGSQTAYMFDAYPSRDDYCGVPVNVGEELRETVVAAARQGWAAWVHAIGDRAVHEAVAALTAARRFAQTALPHRIEHAQCIRATDARRMARAGIVASMQPCHLLGDIPTADRHWPRARRDAFPLRRLLDAGVTLALGSDVPVESLDPRRSLYAAVTRTDDHGEPPGGWFPEQRISVEEAVRGFTVGAAASVGGSPLEGTLMPGARADLTIWRDDPFTAPDEHLLEIGIAGVVVDGQVHLTEQY